VSGVHYFSDYLEEQKLTYAENFSMTVPLFDGGSIRI